MRSPTAGEAEGSTGWPEDASYDPEDATGNSLLIPLSRFLLLWRTPPFKSIGRGTFFVCFGWIDGIVGKIKHALLPDSRRGGRVTQAMRVYQRDVSFLFSRTEARTARFFQFQPP
jgi:hypothetical protein